ncbi:acid-sensing ion channel 2-like isoform X2 [Mercenaria mercenaria]|uniref:acid-sensing ion channel 2-like isoform X2 n=1 Tax=Mercenaria mercenaria TaxID=6596 RepID=UPI00234F1EA9|nr:acid-sensing ion channel 2-like isoform X2 [Mercenaria mercenaria]
MSVETYKLPNDEQQSEGAGSHEMIESSQVPEVSDADLHGNEVREEAKVCETAERKQSQLDRFWDTLHEWADITTLHGTRFVFDRNSYVVRRATWFVIMICFVFVLIWNGQAQVNRYFEYRPLTVQTMKVHEKLLFPSVTICNSRFIRNDSVTNDTERITIEQVLQVVPNKTLLLTEVGETILKTTRFSSLMMKHTTKLDDFILTCSWKGLPLNCSEYFIGRLAENGLCYTTTEGSFETSVVGDRYGLEIVLWSGQDIAIGAGDENYGTKVLVHESTDEPNMESASIIGPGVMHYIPVTAHVFDYLPYPVAAFGGQYCIDTTADTELHSHYSITGCYRECRQKFILEHCGCVSHVDKDYKGGKECSAYEIMDCYQPTLVSFMSQVEQCHCATPCHITKYQTRLSSTFLPDSAYKTVQKKIQINDPIETLRENLIILKLFYESKEVTYIEQVLEFTFEDLWASFGGYLGIAVGASLLTFVEILDLIVMNVYHHLKRIRNIVREEPT